MKQKIEFQVIEAYAKEVASTNANTVVQTGPLLRRMNDRLPDERILRTDHLTVAIPLDATADELKAMALKLIEFASSALTATPAATAGVAAQT